MKKLVGLVFVLVLGLSLTRLALAVENPPNPVVWQGETWFAPSSQTWQQKVFGNDKAQMFKERYTLSVLIDVAQSINAAVGGATTIAQGPDGPVYSYSGGAISALAGLSGSLYDYRPASSIDYLAYLGENLGLAKPAYAQGPGFTSLSSLLPLWRTFRDLAYLAFVIVFVVIGLMIMFRMKIDPRTTLSIQEALPRIVIALLMVTFSYALIGLAVDIMNVFNHLIVKLLLPGVSTVDIRTFLANHIFNYIWTFQPLIAELGKNLSSVVLTKGMTAIISLGLEIVFNVALFFAMIKIFFMLLGSYVNIVLKVIFAPLQSALSALPGRETSPAGWLRDLVADLAIFPATLAMLSLAFRFISAGATAGTHFLSPPWSLVNPWDKINVGWQPPFMQGFVNNIGVFIGFGIILAIPAVGDSIKQALQIKPGALGEAAGKELRGGFSWVPIVGGMAR